VNRAESSGAADTGRRIAPGSVRLISMLIVAATCAVLTTILIQVSTVQPVDLAVYRASGYSLTHGIGLYGTDFPAELPFTYPPFAAWPLVVLVPLPWSLTVWSWTFLTLALLAWVVSRSFAPVLPSAPLHRAIVLSALVAAFSVVVPVSDHIGFGQINMLLMAAALADLLGARPRWLPAGMLIGIAAAVKLVPAVFILYLLITRRTRAAAVGGISAVLATAVAYVVRPADSRTYFFDLLWHLDVRVGLGNNATIGNQSIQGAFLRLLPGSSVHVAWLAAVVVCFCAGMWVARRAYAFRGDIAGACAVGLVAVLVSPVSWTHYLVWMIPAVGLMLGDGRRIPGRTAAIFVYAILVSRIHRLGQNIVDTHPGWFWRIIGEIGANGYVLLSIGVLVWLSVRPSIVIPQRHGLGVAQKNTKPLLSPDIG
jgi:alpha-1,2-mannosyltransferase